MVTGCLAQRYGEDLQKELPEVDLIVGFENYGMLPSLVEESLRERDDESRIVSPFDPASQKRSGSASGTVSKNIITNDDLVLPKKKTLVGGNSPPFRSEIDRAADYAKTLGVFTPEPKGCDHKCTFCAIPSFRGKFRSKKFEPIVDEAKALGQLGAKELCLIAEDTNQWGMDLRAQDGRGLAELLKR